MFETRLERHPRSSSRLAGVPRIGCRVVVVAGFAGAAWMLSSSAASAAGVSGPAAPIAPSSTTTVQPLTSSVVSLVTDLGTGSLNTLLGTSASGSYAGTSTSKVLTEVLAPTNTVLTTHGASPVPDISGDGTPAHPTSAPMAERAPDAVAGTPSAAVPFASTPLNAGQPMIGIADPILAPSRDVPSPVTTVSRCVAASVDDVLGPLTRPILGIVMRSTDDASIAAVTASRVARAAVHRSAMVASTPVTPPPIRTPGTTNIRATPVRVDPGTPDPGAYASAGIRGAPVLGR